MTAEYGIGAPGPNGDHEERNEEVQPSMVREISSMEAETFADNGRNYTFA